MRLVRIRSHIDDELAGLFGHFDLTAADFTVIAALRRAGAPYTLTQSVLMSRLGLTSGTVSVRLSRLDSKGAVTRRPSTQDSRGVLITLTDLGRELFDQVAPQHLAHEEVLLSALTDDECEHLAGLLRKLLFSFEHKQSPSPFGMTLAPAQITRRARTAVGLSDRAGLLVQHVAPGSTADRAGLQSGDVLVGLSGQPLLSCLDLATAATDGQPLPLRVLRGEEEREICLGDQAAG